MVDRLQSVRVASNQLFAVLVSSPRRPRAPWCVLVGPVVVYRPYAGQK